MVDRKRKHAEMAVVRIQSASDKDRLLQIPVRLFPQSKKTKHRNNRKCTIVTESDCSAQSNRPIIPLESHRCHVCKRQSHQVSSIISSLNLICTVCDEKTCHICMRECEECEKFVCSQCCSDLEVVTCNKCLSKSRDEAT